MGTEKLVVCHHADNHSAQCGCILHNWFLLQPKTFTVTLILHHEKYMYSRGHKTAEEDTL